jgi:hypothetical protein
MRKSISIVFALAVSWLLADVVWAEKVNLETKVSRDDLRKICGSFGNGHYAEGGGSYSCTRQCTDRAGCKVECKDGGGCTGTTPGQARVGTGARGNVTFDQVLMNKLGGPTDTTKVKAGVGAVPGSSPTISGGASTGTPGAKPGPAIPAAGLLSDSPTAAPTAPGRAQTGKKPAGVDAVAPSGIKPTTQSR